jgi:hypothetical protein
MITVDNDTQAHWLQTGRVPLAGQFVAWLSKYWQKGEKIPADDIEGLGTSLSSLTRAFTMQPLTYASTVAWDAALGHKATLTLGGNATLGGITNAGAGSRFTLYITQDSTGSRTLSYDSNFKFPGSIPPTLTATARAVDILEFEADSATTIRLVNFIANSK